jgi:hypothetical protein
MGYEPTEASAGELSYSTCCAILIMVGGAAILLRHVTTPGEVGLLFRRSNSESSLSGYSVRVVVLYDG